MYADDHPGVLNLDIDQVRCLIGGWQRRFGEAGELVRPIAINMARTHLGAGRDVVMPQYLGLVNEIERFEAAAAESGAAFCEVMLMDDKERSLDRFSLRGHGADSVWHAEVRRLVEQNGGRNLLADMYDRLGEVLQARSAYTVIRSESGAIAETYDALTSTLDHGEL